MLKDYFSSPLILQHFNPKQLIKLETDTSGFATSRILLQLFEDNQWHLIAFHSKKNRGYEYTSIYNLGGFISLVDFTSRS